MAVVSISRIQVRRGQENQTGVPTLAGGEFAWAADTEHLYIGLRREDGGARDANVRILTENDVHNLFTTMDANYSYRSDTVPAITAGTYGGQAVERPIRIKADDIVSIKDFGVVGHGGAEVASALIQVAVDNLFLDPLKTISDYGKYSAKILILPAGVYNIDTAIFVPRYTTIIGEGVGKTIINLISNASHAFQTIDSDPSNAIGSARVTFEIGIGSGVTQPNYLHLQGMTIQYDPTVAKDNAQSLISLDCSENAILRDVKIAGAHATGDAATTGYSGIDIRGYGSMQASSENILIDNCEFDGLYHCIKSNYDIPSPVIQNSKFKNSVRGISFNDIKDASADVGPRFARIVNNRFENIEQQAIYSGESGSGLETNHVSMNNKFYNCGEYGIRGNTTGTAVVTFLTDGNISKNDWFDRQEYQMQNIQSVQPYFPLIEGRAAIDNGEVKSIGLTNEVFTPVLRLPTTGYTQRLVIKYNLFEYTAGVDRMGTLTVHLQNGNVTDDYTYTTGEGTTAWNVISNPVNTFYEIQLKFTGSANATFEYQTLLML